MRAFKSGVVAGGAIVAAPVAVPAVEKSISISCERTTVSGKSGIKCVGETTGFSSGTTVVPYLRFPGDSAYSAGSARPEISSLGNFEYSRKTGKRVVIYFASSDGVVQSNKIIISAS
jgi:hypothetical protein